MTPALRSGWGLARSLAIYRLRPWRASALSRFYRQFLSPGDLAFDIGAHVGNRTLAMRGAGARVVAVEPQRLFHSFLRLTLPLDVTLLPLAVGPSAGEASLAVSRLHPTVSSLNADYPTTVGRSDGFDHVAWDSAETVEVTTLDAMIDEYGMPRLVKLDVEGYEAEALAGLTRPVPIVAFEYLPAALDVARTAIDLLESIGNYEFNLVRGEEDRFALSAWSDAATLVAALAEVGNDSSRSGDVYARLVAGEQ